MRIEHVAMYVNDLEGTNLKKMPYVHILKT